MTRWEIERDRFGVMFSGPLEVGDCIEVAPASLVLSEEERGVIDWYVHCLENVADRRAVRGLDEAKVGYERVMRKFLNAEAAAR